MPVRKKIHAACNFKGSSLPLLGVTTLIVLNVAAPLEQICEMLKSGVLHTEIQSVGRSISVGEIAVKRRALPPALRARDDAALRALGDKVQWPERRRLLTSTLRNSTPLSISRVPRTVLEHPHEQEKAARVHAGQ